MPSRSRSRSPRYGGESIRSNDRRRRSRSPDRKSGPVRRSYSPSPPRRRSRSPRYRSRSRSPKRYRRRSRTRSRSGSPMRSRRSRSRSPRSRRHKDSKSSNQDKRKSSGKSNDVSLEGLDEEEKMMKLMGFSNFDTTKGKHVEGASNAGATRIQQKRRYRQYMNRRGGFNRPLDPVA